MLTDEQQTAETPRIRWDFVPSAPARTRTLDPLIKSQLLYRLSYKGYIGL